MIAVIKKDKQTLGFEKVRINPDLTFLQRVKKKKLFEELAIRKKNGEQNINVNFKLGQVCIGRMQNPVQAEQEMS